MGHKGRISALLGPTNTGKTYNAIERMLGYENGVIGLPLRLLAREVFDKLTGLRGTSVIALVTGEERIIPKNPKYWVCTVEAMPMDLGLEFVAIDEIQLCSDHERGHIFTDRLLHARGKKETMFLGSETISSRLKNLFPDIKVSRSERFSTLYFAGKSKLSRIPERSAVVSFSINEIYATAELIRRQKGGAAVIMGALSPRIRNAQVDLYQNGDVDFLVATDAIGMGLNLDLKHVSFSKLYKFDGKRERKLYPTEIGQIAGRAGRFTKNGTFGVTGEAENLEPTIAAAIEKSHFPQIKFLQWRNSNLNFTSVTGLIQSLEQKPTNENFVKADEGIDLKVFKTLSETEPLKGNINSVKDIKLLWEVCQIPDFRKISEFDHSTLLKEIFNFLKNDGILPDYWLHDQIKRLNILEGNIDALAKRLAFIRTWTFVSYKKSWLNDSLKWQGETRLIEDKLSDELHKKLTQRFVDQRTSVLVKGLKQRENLVAEINDDGEIFVDAQLIGRLVGLKFETDKSTSKEEKKAIKAAAGVVLGPQYHLRSEKIYNTSDEKFSIDEIGQIKWDNAAIGKLKMGSTILTPSIIPIVDVEAGPKIVEKLQRRLDHFIQRTIENQFEPLLKMKEDHNLVGLSRGIAFRLVEALGVVPRDEVAEDIKSLEQSERANLRRHGIRFGQFTIFNQLMLKPAPTKLRLLLHSLMSGRSYPAPPQPGLVSIPSIPGAPSDYYSKVGYRLLGSRALRVDMLERLSDLLRTQNIWRGFEASVDMLSITGLTLDQFADLMHSLGYVSERDVRKKAISESETSIASNKKDMESMLEEKTLEKVSSKVELAVSETNLEKIKLPQTHLEDGMEAFYIFKYKKMNNTKDRKKLSAKVLQIKTGLSNKGDGAEPFEKGNRRKRVKNKNSSRPSVIEDKKKTGRNVDPHNPFAALLVLKDKL